MFVCSTYESYQKAWRNIACISPQSQRSLMAAVHCFNCSKVGSGSGFELWKMNWEGQQHIKKWEVGGLGVTMEWTGELGGLNPPTSRQFEPWSGCPGPDIFGWGAWEWGSDNSHKKKSLLIFVRWRSGVKLLAKVQPRGISAFGWKCLPKIDYYFISNILDLDMDHATNIDRLRHTFGIESSAIGWLMSYLTNRSQFREVRRCPVSTYKL